MPVEAAAKAALVRCAPFPTLQTRSDAATEAMRTGTERQEMNGMPAYWNTVGSDPAGTVMSARKRGQVSRQAVIPGRSQGEGQCARPEGLAKHGSGVSASSRRRRSGSSVTRKRSSEMTDQIGGLGLPGRETR